MSMFLEAASRRIKGLVFADESGQTLVEYGLIVALISIAAIAGVSLVASQVDSIWGGIASDVADAVTYLLTEAASQITGSTIELPGSTGAEVARISSRLSRVRLDGDHLEQIRQERAAKRAEG